MKWMNNLNIKNKLLLGFALLLTFVLVFVAVAYNGLSTMRDTQRTLTHIEYPLTLELLKLRTNINRERSTINRIVLIQAERKYAEWRSELISLDTTITAISDSIKILAKENPIIIGGIQEFTAKRKIYKTYIDTLLNVYNTSKTQHKVEGLLIGVMYELNETMREIILGLSKISESSDENLIRENENAFSFVVRSFSVFGVLLIMICIGLTMFFVKIIAKPIEDLAKQAENIAYGDLTMDVQVKKGKDEIAVMQRSFGMMVSSLRAVSKELKSTIGTLDSLNTEINSELQIGFNDTAAILKWIEKLTANVNRISKNLNTLMSEFKI